MYTSSEPANRGRDRTDTDPYSVTPRVASTASQLELHSKLTGRVLSLGDGTCRPMTPECVRQRRRRPVAAAVGVDAMSQMLVSETS